MNKTPKIGVFLAVISLLFCLTLVVGLFFAYLEGRQPKDYQAEDQPEGVAYNYLLALVNKDFQRAYGYLSPELPGYPSNDDTFREMLEEQELLPEYEIDPCVYIEGVNLDQDKAVVDLRMQYYDPCLKGWWSEIENLTQTPGQMKLEETGGSWMIVGADDWFFFSNCWVDLNQCDQIKD